VLITNLHEQTDNFFFVGLLIFKIWFGSPGCERGFGVDQNSGDGRGQIAAGKIGSRFSNYSMPLALASLA
jgi:hypothetical protein